MMGVFQEHGPWVVEDGTRMLVPNKDSWNKKANMLYIEMPGGVGYSTCDEKAGECIFTDQKTADDNITALLAWFNEYSDFKDHKLFISGESYGGVYVPYAAKGVLEYNDEHQGATDFNFNLMGFIVGNGVTNWKYDTDPAFIKMGFWHGLYDYPMKKAMDDNKCDFSMMEFGNVLSTECQKLYDRFLELTATINTYDVYRHCYDSKNEFLELFSEDNLGMAKVGNSIKTYRKFYTTADYTPWLYHADVREARKMVAEIPPCVYGSYVVDYLNLYEVRDALFIPEEVQAWTYCVENPAWNYTSGKDASYDIYIWMKEKHPEIKFLIYSGDTDGSVPTQGSLAWLDSLNYEVS